MKVKFLEVRENGRITEWAEGSDDDITEPVTIEFTIDKKDYETLKRITGEYKWSTYDALSMFCKFSEELVSEMEHNEDGRFRIPPSPEEEFWKHFGEIIRNQMEQNT